MSRYLNPNRALDRLRQEWDKYGSIIVAFDIDSTVLPFHPDEVTDAYEPIRDLLRGLKALGCTLIAFTAASEDLIPYIKEALKTLEVKWDYFNESPPSIPNVTKQGKVYANVYLDDRAGMYEVYSHLRQLLQEKRLENSMKAFRAIGRQNSHP